jgi:FkbM family methyltransferase
MVDVVDARSPKSLVKEDGFYWPLGGEKYRHRYIKHAPDMNVALKYAHGRRVVLQAGGNVGVWPKWLASRFDRVYTFEPEPLNFMALCRNAWEPNVFKTNGALGFERGCIDLSIHLNNIGAHTVRGAGVIPSYRIDDLALAVCDALILDIEGFELPALRGAADTLDRCSPVVMIEDRGHGAKIGQGSFADTAEFLGTFGYRETERVAKDVVFVRS